jgi:hypothetical protein
VRQRGYTRAVDLYAALMFGGVALLLLALILIGLRYPGSGAEQVGWKSPRAQAEQESARESEDLAQMLEAANARRRARGQSELTVGELAAETLRDDW